MLKKKGAIYSVIALMLCVAVYLNWSYSRTSAPGEEGYEADNKLLGQAVLVDSEATEPEAEAGGNRAIASANEDYFSEAKLSRQQARDEAVSILNTTIENENASEEAKSAANTNIQVMADNAMIESRIENLVVAKGYSKCVAFVNDNGVNVIIAKTAEGLTDSDVAKIRDIVIGEAGVGSDQIKIIETA